MSAAYDFIKECGSFFVLTVDRDGLPAGRPFGAIMESGEHLYISTNDRNSVHQQLRANGHIQLLAKKPDSRQWIRVTGIAEECSDETLRQQMLVACPQLQTIFAQQGLEHFLLFRVTVQNVEMH
jgi:uncharacterized pyridoxamine 5'-phosphate oxidase family protein